MDGGNCEPDVPHTSRKAVQDFIHALYMGASAAWPRIPSCVRVHMGSTRRTAATGSYTAYQGRLGAYVCMYMCAHRSFYVGALCVHVLTHMYVYAQPILVCVKLLDDSGKSWTDKS